MPHRSPRLSGKACVCLYEDALVFKLTGNGHQHALKLAGATLWDPSGRNRPMKEWVQVPFEHAIQWPTLAQNALDYVGG